MLNAELIVLRSIGVPDAVLLPENRLLIGARRMVPAAESRLTVDSDDEAKRWAELLAAFIEEYAAGTFDAAIEAGGNSSRQFLRNAASRDVLERHKDAAKGLVARDRIVAYLIDALVAYSETHRYSLRPAAGPSMPRG